ncbi:MAG: N-acetylmuramoyl-L-alanine amidase [Acidimicrobiia bacterium]
MLRYLAALALLTVACTGATVGEGLATGVGTSPTTTSSIPITTSTSTTTLVQPTTTPPNSTVPAPPPAALISPSGIPVGVLHTDGPLHTVLTPCGNEGYLARGTPLYEVTVALDPGHGGPVDTGAWGANGLMEKDINLRVAEATAERLGERGVSVILTRTGDYSSPLYVRASLADSLNAELILSIHHNAPTPGPSTEPGIEVFYQAGSPAARRLGGLVWKHTMSALSGFDVRWAASPDAGAMTVLNTRGDDAYGILRHPETVSALVELGYISNRPEAELFATVEYVSAVSAALADAVVAYLNTDDRGAGYVTGRVFNPAPGVSRAVCEDPDLS